ncbi:hypothetical protein Hanom_Chr02g00164001 [Helianthus anomalus]
MSLSLKWRDEVFPVMIEEEVGEWTPDCLEEGSVASKESMHDDDPLRKDDTGVDLNVDPFVGIEIGQNEMHDNDVQDIGLVKEVFTSHVSGGQVNRESKFKRRGCFRKKTRPDKSPSSIGQGRPKKRSREGDNPFDIDRFIFPVNERYKVGVLGGEAQEEFVTPDLNKDSGNVVTGANEVESNSIEGDGNKVGEENVEEVVETV